MARFDAREASALARAAKNRVFSGLRAALGAFGGLALSVRPELTAYAVLAPLALVVLERDRARRRFGLAALAATAGVLALHLGVAKLYLSTPLATAGKDLAGAVAANRLGHFNLVKHGSTSGPQKYWFAIDRVSTLPDDLVMATTEVGMLGAMNLEKTIVDLAGLNDRRFALEPFSADRLFEAYKPDLIYMPHPHYVKMIDDLGAHPEMSRYVATRRRSSGQRCSASPSGATAPTSSDCSRS
ncbi:hypothetical protein [Sorangium sp. So ce362]|uniref:hypothetical protein n=1 Tax=Sorangium sp. So ce362 TaxID=3133303 RepID=UPI003F641EF7